MYFTDFKVLPREADLNHPKEGQLARILWAEEQAKGFSKRKEKKTEWHMVSPGG